MTLTKLSFLGALLGCGSWLQACQTPKNDKKQNTSEDSMAKDLYQCLVQTETTREFALKKLGGNCSLPDPVCKEKLSALIEGYHASQQRCLNKTVNEYYLTTR